MTTEEDDFVSVEAISGDALEILAACSFFQKLEKLVFPDSNEKSVCSHSYGLAKRLLADEGFDEAAQDILLAVLQHLGGCCDCEILLNVDEREDGRKAKYWRGRTAKGQE